MFLIRRPTSLEIEQFIRESKRLALSYAPVGITKADAARFTIDEARAVIGHGERAFERARRALMTWRQFELGWVELFPHDASIQNDTIVAVVVRHLGFWSINGCRVVYQIGDRDLGSVFGFAYGTLSDHAERGEELFEVSLDAKTGEVIYRLRAAAKPRAAVARIGYPITRLLQARFRRDSISAMVRATQ